MSEQPVLPWTCVRTLNVTGFFGHIVPQVRAEARASSQHRLNGTRGWLTKARLRAPDQTKKQRTRLAAVKLEIGSGGFGRVGRRFVATMDLPRLGWPASCVGAHHRHGSSLCASRNRGWQL